MFLGGSMLIPIAFLSIMLGAVGVILGIDYSQNSNLIASVSIALTVISLILLVEIYRSLKIYEKVKDYLPNMYITPLFTFAVGIGVLAYYWRPVGDEDVIRALGILLSFTGAIMFLTSMCYIDDEIEAENKQNSDKAKAQ